MNTARRKRLREIAEQLDALRADLDETNQPPASAGKGEDA